MLDAETDIGILQSIVNALPDPAFFVRQDFIIACANPPAEKLFDTQLKGELFARILRQPEAKGCLVAAYDSGELETCELTLRVPSNRVYKGSAAIVEDNILFSLQDISAKLNAEKSRSTFVANVSHELRSPLTALAGVVETLQGPARNDEKARDRFLKLMQGETERMRVIAVLSESAPGHKGRVKFESSETDIFIAGDRDELTEVFQNLIENALKYSPPDSPVDIEMIIDAVDSKVSVKIKDQGDGIAKEHLPRLTERFYRVDKGRSRKMGGTGLGLAITKHILSRHRARLTFDSELGQGTEVSVTFNLIS